MSRYAYGRIGKLAESLEKHGIPQDISGQILLGGETVQEHSRAEVKIAWMQAAMQRMDTLLEVETRRAVREACACCLGGKRLKLSKAIAKEHETFEARIKAANETQFVFGHSVSMLEDGKIMVQFQPEGLPGYRCSCLPGAKEPLSITYCFCCGGHVKHHMQTALERRLEVRVKSSVLSSGGEQPCRFVLSMMDDENQPAA